MMVLALPSSNWEIEPTSGGGVGSTPFFFSLLAFPPLCSVWKFPQPADTLPLKESGGGSRTPDPTWS